MPFFSASDGGRIHYRANKSKGPALIFVHGWCSNLNHFSNQYRAFSGTHRLLAMDRLGCGRSSVPDSDISPKVHADHLAELAMSLDISDAVVVGHAGGGPTTLEFARRHPRLARALVLIDAGLYRGVRKNEAQQSPFARRLERDDYLDFFIPQYRSYFHPQSGVEIAEKAARDAAKTPQRVIVNEILWILRANTIAMARRIRQPVLWVVSSESRQTAQHVKRCLRRAEFAQVVKAGHFLHMEAPDQFNPMLARFIESLD